MHGNLPLLLTLTGGLAAALIFGFITQRLRLSPIVGYLLAGIAIGPFTPGFTADRHIAEQLAEVGIILLMFGVGLSFHLKELLAVRRIALPGALVQIAVATSLGTVLGLAVGWGLGAGVVFGLAISVASTVVLIRVLSDYNDLHTPTGHIAVGWLVVEDIFTVLVLVILPVLAGGTDAAQTLAISLGITAFKILALLLIVFYLGGRLIPWLLSRVAATGSRELFTLTVLVVALGVAVGAAQIFGVSMALGAFLGGMVVGRSEFSLRAATEALPMRDAFAVLFFVSVGMLFDWRLLVESFWTVLATIAIILVGKPLAALGIVLLMRYPLRIALAVAVALAQIGEFSFILAALGNQLAILPQAAYQAMVAASIITISLNPLLYRLVDPSDKWLAAALSLSRSKLNRLPGTRMPEPPRPGAVIVGYGPVGRTVSRLLRDNGIEPAIIEMNLDTVRALRDDGTSAVYGDASHIDILRAAGVQHASALILSASGLMNAEEVIRQARQLNPAIRVLARSVYVRDQSGLLRAGADTVLSAEAEIALGMTATLLRSLGATAEQIDRERERVHRELGVPEEGGP